MADGIDTVSTVTINDELIGRTDNQFIRYKFDVKKVLKLGPNVIRVAIQSAPLYSMERAKQYETQYKYKVFVCNKGADNECYFDFIRKMAASYSWDWGPAFPTQGIWKPIGIEAYDKAVLRDVMVDTKPNPKNSSQWVLTVSTYVESASLKQIDTILDISLDDKILVSKQKHSLKTDSLGSVKLDMVIPIPQHIPISAWYPNGVANRTQQLYKLRVDLSFPDSTEQSTQTKRIGFRTIR
ncbi:unnamed protein product, partial [Oppiella nova]